MAVFTRDVDGDIWFTNSSVDDIGLDYNCPCGNPDLPDSYLNPIGDGLGTGSPLDILGDLVDIPYWPEYLEVS